MVHSYWRKESEFCCIKGLTRHKYTVYMMWISLINDKWWFVLSKCICRNMMRVSETLTVGSSVSWSSWTQTCFCCFTTEVKYYSSITKSLRVNEIMMRAATSRCIVGKPVQPLHCSASLSALKIPCGYHGNRLQSFSVTVTTTERRRERNGPTIKP